MILTARRAMSISWATATQHPNPCSPSFVRCAPSTRRTRVAFDVDALRVELIREELEYGGLRLRTTAGLAGARITIVIDIGFGDATAPGVEDIELPVLLNLPAPHLRAYPRETVIAEKFQAPEPGRRSFCPPLTRSAMVHKGNRASGSSRRCPRSC
jgi:hypothetical protein